MGFWNFLGKVATGIIEQGMEARARQEKEMARRMKEYERKLANAEKSSKMNDPAYAQKVKEAREKFEAAKQKTYGSTSNRKEKISYESDQLKIGGKTVDEWESRWMYIGNLNTLEGSNLRPFNRYIGVYKAVWNGKIMYIGRAIEHNNRGFAKRLRDYTRESDSARKHGSGQKMHENASRLRIYIIIVGTSAEDVPVVSALEEELIRKYRPPWNVQYNR